MQLDHHLCDPFNIAAHYAFAQMNNRAGPPDSRGKPASQGGAPQTRTFALFYPNPQWQSQNDRLPSRRPWTQIYCRFETMKLHFGLVGFARDNARRGPASVCLVCKSLRYCLLGIVACRMALSHNLEAGKTKRNFFEKHVWR